MNEELNAISLNVSVINKDGVPCIELRRKIMNPDMIKKIINSAFYEEPIMMFPKFTDKLNSLSSLIRIGILYKDENGQYVFTI